MCFVMFCTFYKRENNVPANSPLADINGFWLKLLGRIFLLLIKGSIFSRGPFFLISSGHPFYFDISFLFVLQVIHF